MEKIRYDRKYNSTLVCADNHVGVESLAYHVTERRATSAQRRTRTRPPFPLNPLSVAVEESNERMSCLIDRLPYLFPRRRDYRSRTENPTLAPTCISFSDLAVAGKPAARVFAAFA